MFIGETAGKARRASKRKRIVVMLVAGLMVALVADLLLFAVAEVQDAAGRMQ
jgi:hypothetical protein